MSFQSPESSNQDSFGTPSWESQDKKSFGCRCREQMQRILYGGRWCFPRVQAVVSQVSPKLLVACPDTKSVQNEFLTTLWLVLDARLNNEVACLSS
jgi:hypothetical protein